VSGSTGSPPEALSQSKGGRRLLLISANLETFPAPVYPQALARLAAAAAAAGHTVRQYDLLAHGSEALPGVLAEFRPELVGVSIRNVDNAESGTARSYVDGYVRLAEEIRRHSAAPLVLGGSGFGLFPEQLRGLLGADFGVVGAGERPLCRLLAALDGGAGPAGLPRLIGPEERGGSSAAAPDPQMAGALHDPAIVGHYLRNGGMFGIQTKRGCPRRCSYCTYPQIDGQTVAWGDPAGLAEEMARMHREWGIAYFFMADSVFNLCPERELAFAEELRRRRLPVSWGAFFVPAGMDRDYAQALGAAGLKHAEFGTDALCDQMLAAYGKGFSVEEAVRTSELFAAAGVACAHYLLFGGPGETEATVRRTMANARRLERSAFLPFAGVRVYPGTGIFAAARREGLVRDEADCLRPVFYLAAGLDAPGIWKIVEEAGGSARQWVLPSKYAELAPQMKHLRKLGVTGPLWEYLVA
jgi:radical SAM superfamily enzyme YgiQ (UPF0313 family)